jgi:hypothetical protein
VLDSKPVRSDIRTGSSKELLVLGDGEEACHQSIPDGHRILVNDVRQFVRVPKYILRDVSIAAQLLVKEQDLSQRQNRTLNDAAASPNLAEEERKGWRWPPNRSTVSPVWVSISSRSPL